MMRIRHSDYFIRQYLEAPTKVQKAYKKQERFLVENLRHPSLRAKKYDGSRDIWQARVNRDWRFFFNIHDDTYFLHEITRHS